MENIKKNFLQRLKISIFNVEKYQDLALEKFNVALKYFIKLILVFAIIISLAAVYKFGNIANFFIDAFKSDFPEFTFSNNTLEAEEVVNAVKESKQLKLGMIVDTNIDSNNEEEINKYITQISDYPNGAIFLKDKMILQIDGVSGQVTYNYKDLGTGEMNDITKQSILSTLENTNMGVMYIAFFISICIYMFMLYLISTAMETVFIGLIGFFTAKIVRVNMKFSQIYSMAIYSITLSVLLNAIYTPIRLLTGFYMEYFPVMYTLIPYVYIITAILMTRTELVKQQIEIGKIEEVQKDVKQEIEEEKQKELERERQKEKEKQKEKKKKEENGEQPEGSEA